MEIIFASEKSGRSLKRRNLTNLIKVNWFFGTNDKHLRLCAPSLYYTKPPEALASPSFAADHQFMAQSSGSVLCVWCNAACCTNYKWFTFRWGSQTATLAELCGRTQDPANHHHRRTISAKNELIRDFISGVCQRPLLGLTQFLWARLVGCW